MMNREHDVVRKGSRTSGVMPMLVSRLMWLIPCLLIAGAAPAWSQEPTSPPPIERYVTGAAGAAFAVDTVAAFSGEYGEVVSRRFHAYANYSYIDNLMTDAMRTNLAVAGEVLTAVTGTTRSFTGRDRGLAFTVGAKFMPGHSAFRPYVGGGAGALHLRRTVTEASLGNVTESFAAESGLNDGVIPAGQTSSMKPLAEGMGGLFIVHGRTAVDVSYRYRKAFHAADLSFSQFGVGLGVTF
jgi:opacity protein-like surface antigen